ncbi:MAG: glutamate 5-kinase [Butyricicoccus pullicaecorum]|jgi:glutamate 5-kinase|nr:glutamate 5-kinase [Butyricicoccus pullicaecorum]
MSQNHAMRRIVVKVGTSSLTYPNGKLNIGCIEKLVRVISDLQNRGCQMVLVSSGAVGVGAAKLGWHERPRDIRMKQAAAAVGQCELMHIYDKMFLEYGVKSAQILLTRENITNEEQRANIHSTFDILLDHAVVPIVNENDTVATAELECIETFGDNDTLSAVVSRVCAADLLVIFTDIEGLYDSNPRENPDAKLIDRVEKIDASLWAVAGGPGSANGTGGMATKLGAAELCMDAGISMLITKGDTPEILYDIVDGKPVGTLFKRPQKERLS